MCRSCQHPRRRGGKLGLISGIWRPEPGPRGFLPGPGAGRGAPIQKRLRGLSRGAALVQPGRAALLWLQRSGLGAHRRRAWGVSRPPASCWDHHLPIRTLRSPLLKVFHYSTVPPSSSASRVGLESSGPLPSARPCGDIGLPPPPHPLLPSLARSVRDTHTAPPADTGARWLGRDLSCFP